MAARKPKPAAAEADSGLTAIRTTFNPSEVIQVGDAELLDLDRQGLVYYGDDDPTPAQDDEPAGNGETDDVTTNNQEVTP